MTCGGALRDSCPPRHGRRLLRTAVPCVRPGAGVVTCHRRAPLVFIQWVLVEPANVASAVAISDPNDQPILDAAIAAAVDVIVTGDKRFHALDVETPRILTARGFIENYPPPG